MRQDHFDKQKVRLVGGDGDGELVTVVKIQNEVKRLKGSANSRTPGGGDVTFNDLTDWETYVRKSDTEFELAESK